MTPYGIVLGRFQPLHLGHVEYLEAAKARCERLVVGVTNPDATPSFIFEADQKRSLAANNPFTYMHRHLMIERALLGLGWLAASFCIVAAPITDPARLVAYLPPPARSEFFSTIYDEWGEHKAREVAALGYSTTTLWRRTYAERLTTGSFVREAIRTGKPWEHLVPDEIVSYIDDNDLREIV